MPTATAHKILRSKIYAEDSSGVARPTKAHELLLVSMDPWDQVQRVLDRRLAKRAMKAKQVPQVRQALDRYREMKETLQAISELNQYLFRLDRDESKGRQA